MRESDVIDDGGKPNQYTKSLVGYVVLQLHHYCTRVMRSLCSYLASPIINVTYRL